MNHRMKNGIKHRLALILVIMSVIIGLTSFDSFFNKEPYPTEIPMMLPELHDYAVGIPVQNDDPTKMEVSENGGGASVICSSIAEASKKSKTVEFYYKNPSRSLASVVLQIKVDDQVLAQSGAIPPGYQSYTLDLNTDIKWKTGDYVGTLIISFYELDTNERVNVDTEVGINISINK